MKDLHDRYANIDISHLLKRIEGYGGIVLVTPKRATPQLQRYPAACSSKISA